MRNKPRIRFKGFTEDWEQRKLDDIAKIKTGGGTPKTANPEYWSGNIPWIQSSDLVEGDIVHVNINKFINNNALKNSAAKLISRDSIALVTRVGVGKVAVINQDFTTSQDFLSLSDFDGNDIKFLAYQLYRLMQENAKVLQGTSIKGITKTELIEQSISIPSSGQEQNLISNVLSKIDSFITLHQRKLEKLKLAKKALLQKLFPKNGSQFPEIRFKGFTDAWEQRKLGAMCSLFTDGDWIESKDQSNEGIRLIQTGNIGVGKFIDKPENKKWISHSTFDNLRCKELLDGDILISRLPHPAGRACIVSTNNEKWITAVDCTIVRLLDRYSNKFILQSLCTYNYFHLIDSFLAGGTRQRVSRSNLSDINIMSPEKIEQDKIGLFFECIDNLITLHQCKLDKLQDVKKGLLQKMFV